MPVRFNLIYRNSLLLILLVLIGSWKEKEGGPVNYSLSGNDWMVVSADSGEGEKNGYDKKHYPVSGAIPAKVPGDINWDLMRSGELPDIFVGMNAKKTYPYALKEWWYRKTFIIKKGQWGNKRIRLNFAAVDYAAKIWLNGHLLGSHTGQFTPFSFEVNGKVNFGEENELIVLIQPAPSNIMDAFVNGNRWATNAYSVVNETLKFWKSRTMTGWDWGTRLWSMGIWQDVVLTGTDHVYLDKLLIYTQTESPYHEARIQIKLRLNSRDKRAVKLVYEAEHINGKASRASSAQVVSSDDSTKQIEHAFDLKDPALWWPNGYGEQNLYLLKVTAIDAKTGQVLDVISSRFGVRNIKVLQNAGASDYVQPDQALKYLTQINGQQIFLHGGNWLPADLLFGRPGEKEYEHLIRMAALANYNVLRIWSGGLIEKQLFYDLCDEYGILVYQEMPNVFAGPLDTPEILKNMAQEQREVMPLLINHPSVFRYGFGNELDLFSENSVHVRQYEEICKELDPDRPAHGSDPNPLYQRHGPYSFAFPAGYAAYNTGLPKDHGPVNALEVTEYSVSGASSFETIQKVIPEQVRWPISSLDTLKKLLPDFPKELVPLPAAVDSVWLWHNGLASFGSLTWLAPDIYRSLFGEQPTLEEEIRSSQFAQAEGYRYAHQTHRRASWHRSGSYMWTFNEPWPNAAHGSIVEYYGRPKMAFYYTRSSYAQVNVSAKLNTISLHPGDLLELPLHVHNARPKGLKNATLKTQIQDLNGKSYFTQSRTVQVEASTTQKADSISFKVPQEAVGNVLLFRIDLTDDAGKSLSSETYTFGVSASDAPENHPYLSPLLRSPKAKVTFTVKKKGAEKWGAKMLDCYQAKVKNTSSVPALFVQLESNYKPDEVYFKDNYFTLLPGEEKDADILVSPNTKQEFNVSDIRLAAWNVQKPAGRF
jgi:beta-mannosidase